MTITGANRYSFHGDEQHTMHLGTDAYLVGSVFADIVLNSGWPGTREENTKRLWTLVSAAYRDMPRPAKISVLRTHMFLRGRAWAAFHGHAMETHHLLLTLPSVLRQLND
eukprot:6017587-Lingulodinium_polyedra.AAC.1